MVGVVEDDPDSTSRELGMAFLLNEGAKIREREP